MSRKQRHDIILHYSEIGLKGGNRAQFENQLVRNIRRALRGLTDAPVKRAFGRLVISLPEQFDWPAIRARLEKVVGLANFSLAVRTAQEVEAIEAAACRQMKGLSFSSFRVTTRRVQKSFPMNSDALSARVGEKIQLQSGARVDLTNPEAVCFIEIFDDLALIYSQKIAGLRGLPVGSGGKAVSLLSSGIDSPVASWKIITRGAKLIFVHFHSAPYTSQASANNAERLVQRLVEYQLSARLYLVPFIETQQAIMLAARSEYRVVLYRRAMLRIATRIARRERAEALVTGESIGQVASQTLSNMRVIDAATDLPVLRPLSGSDKEEIIAIARQIGTFEISTEPYEDCCSLFVPRHPVTRALPAIVEDCEAKADLEPLLRQAARNAEIKKFGYPEAL